MKKHHNKILTLINIEEPIHTIIESTVNLAKTFKADVKFFYVKGPTDTSKGNQLSVIRNKVEEQKAVEKFKIALSRSQKNTSTKLAYTILEGNVKQEIQNQITSYHPDLIVLGKRTPNKYRWIGNQVTEFVLKSFSGPLLISHPSHVLEIKENLSLGVLNDLKSIKDDNVTNTLLKHSKQPLRLFKIGEHSTPIESTDSQSTKTIHYTFENTQNAFQSLSNYVHRNNVHLLCVERSQKTQTFTNMKMKDVLKRINTSMLMLGNNSTKNLIKI